MPLLPPEARLLLLATNPRCAATDAELSALATRDLNWAALGRLAEREKLLPVLWSALREFEGVIPPTIARALQRQASVTEFRMAMMETVLRRVGAQLSGQGIRVMLLKGAALATTIYRAFAARPMGDLDILVAPSEAQLAWAAMRESGWRLELSDTEKFHATHHHLPGLLDPDGLSVVLEIHRAMLPSKGPFTLDESEVWRDARPVELGATTAWVPSDQHQLLHLCIHFAWSHTLVEGVGRTVRDVATLLESGTFAWPQFVELATRTKAATCAYWTLALSKTLAGAAVPADVLESLRPRQLQVETRALERAYVVSGLLRGCPSIHVSRMLWSAGIRPAASGHGASRPWHVSDMFEAVFHHRRPASIGGRLASHARHIPAWIQFAEVIGLPRRVL